MLLFLKKKKQKLNPTTDSPVYYEMILRTDWLTTKQERHSAPTQDSCIFATE